MGMSDAHKMNLSHDVVCNHDDKNLTNKTKLENCAAHSLHVSMFMCFVWKVLGVLVVTLSMVSCVFTTHTQYQV